MLLSNMKQQISDCKMGRVQNFVFSSILSMFFFEKVLGVRPKVDISPHRVWDLAQWCWENFMHRLGGGRVANPYLTEFFPWWQRQLIAIDDYPYAGIEFCGDLDMPLPLGVAYGDIRIKNNGAIKSPSKR